MQPLSHDIIEALREDYRIGFGPSQTAHRQKVSYHTVSAYFRRFSRTGVPRGSAQPYFQSGAIPEPYIGSPWIGKAIAPPPVPSGPDWIGKAA